MSGSIKPSGSSSGFTIVELLISISLIAIISISLLGVFTNYLVIITRNDVLVDMTVDSQNLLRSTVEELRYGDGVRLTNSITDPNNPAGWNTSNTSFVIIIAMPATNANNDYIIDTDTGFPYNNEFVYFKKGTNLYKRVLANPEAIGNKVHNSCPVAVATASCLADRKLIENVKTFAFTLYDQDDAVTTDPLLGRSVKIDLALARDTFGNPLAFDNSIRVTLRNNFK